MTKKGIGYIILPKREAEIMKITDIHSHTYFSACGADKHEDTIEAAIKGGIEVFGISDHC